MRYVDAGYVIALSVLFLYGVSLVARHRRLRRAAAVAGVAGAPDAAGDRREAVPQAGLDDRSGL